MELERINKHGRLENLQYQSQLPVGEEGGLVESDPEREPDFNLGVKSVPN